MVRKKNKGLRNKDIKKQNKGKIKSNISDKETEEVFDELEDYFKRKDLKQRQERIYKGYIDENRSKKEKRFLSVIVFMSFIIVLFGAVIVLYFMGFI